MKTYSKIYGKTYCFIFALFILISIILATIISFIQIPNTMYNIIVQTLSYVTIIASAIYFYKQINNKLLLHSCFFALIYLLLILLLQFNNIQIITLITRPLTFILTSVVLSYIGK
ncbi:MAG: hypothetical protein ACK5LC_06100 [Coprobacillaceae bacterium]